MYYEINWLGFVSVALCDQLDRALCGGMGDPARLAVYVYCVLFAKPLFYLDLYSASVFLRAGLVSTM